MTILLCEKEGPEEVSRPHLLPGNFYEAWKRLHPRTSFPVEQPQWRIIFIGGKGGRVPGLCVRGFWKIRSKKLWEILWLGQFHAWMTPWRRHNGAIWIGSPFLACPFLATLIHGVAGHKEISLAECSGGGKFSERPIEWLKKLLNRVPEAFPNPDSIYRKSRKIPTVQLSPCLPSFASVGFFFGCRFSFVSGPSENSDIPIDVSSSVILTPPSCCSSLHVINGSISKSG